MLLFDLFSKAQKRTRAQIGGENGVWFEFLLSYLFVHYHYDNVNLLVDPITHDTIYDQGFEEEAPISWLQRGWQGVHPVPCWVNKQ